MLSRFTGRGGISRVVSAFLENCHDDRSSVGRRSLLESLAAGGVAPFLAPLDGRVEGATRGALPIRVVFFQEGNGLTPTHVQKAGLTARH